MDEITHILSAIERGDPSASEQLLPLVYEELRKLAAAKMAQENPGQTLQATALVHEAYLRLVDVEKVQRWDSRGHFFSAAAEAMRRILVENARKKGRGKRGGELQRVALNEDAVSNRFDDEIPAVDQALEKLENEDPRAAELVKLRYFGGFSVVEAGELLGLSRATAYRHWTYARAWVRCEILSQADRKKT